MDEKVWLSKYETDLLPKPQNLQFHPILFHSSKKIFEDEESGLWTCTLLKRMLQDFKTVVREKESRWTVREYQFDDAALEEEKKSLQ